MMERSRFISQLTSVSSRHQHEYLYVALINALRVKHKIVKNKVALHRSKLVRCGVGLNAAHAKRGIEENVCLAGQELMKRNS